MNKKIFLPILILLLIASFSGCKGGEKAETVFMNGMEISIDTEELDLRGSSISDFSAVYMLKNLKQIDLRGTGISLSDAEYIRTQLPDCRVIFDVNICGIDYLSSDESLDMPIRITSYNVCYTKLLRCEKAVELMHRARTEDIPFAAFSVVRINSRGYYTSLSFEIPPPVIIKDNIASVITSYSIHYTKLYDPQRY